MLDMLSTVVHTALYNSNFLRLELQCYHEICIYTHIKKKDEPPRLMY